MAATSTLASRFNVALRAGIISLTTLVAISMPLVPANAEDATPAATAQSYDPALVEKGFAVWKGQDCIGCHGWAGNGERIGENPIGPSLRALTYDAQLIREIAMCGRPDSDMPAHDARAYTDDRCYGMTKEDIEGMRLLRGRPMTDDDADALIAYMMEKMVGRPDQPNQDDCKAYYNGKPFCNKYPTAESQGF